MRALLAAAVMVLVGCGGKPKPVLSYWEAQNGQRSFGVQAQGSFGTQLRAVFDLDGPVCDCATVFMGTESAGTASAKDCIPTCTSRRGCSPASACAGKEYGLSYIRRGDELNVCLAGGQCDNFH